VAGGGGNSSPYLRHHAVLRQYDQCEDVEQRRPPVLSPQVGAQYVAREQNRFIIPSILSIGLILIGYLLFALSYLLGEQHREMGLWVGLAITGTHFISVNWWENYSSLYRSSFLDSISEDIGRSRNVIQCIERTQDLFVWKIHKGAFLEQSMLLNIHFEIQKDSKQKRETDPVTVYLYATLWHETCDEMMKIIIHIFRLDKYRPKNNPSNDVSFESHTLSPALYRLGTISTWIL
ncbi:unnamed protein product, partial [Coregonus sp. 'balchen']